MVAGYAPSAVRTARLVHSGEHRFVHAVETYVSSTTFGRATERETVVSCSVRLLADGAALVRLDHRRRRTAGHLADLRIRQRAVALGNEMLRRSREIAR